MGFWSLLGTIARAVAPHAAPHIAKGVVDAARERMGSRNPNQPQEVNADDLNRALATFHERLTIAEERASALETRTILAEAEVARQRAQMKILILALLSWNLLLTVLVIWLFVLRK
jgi:hypothetical protein